MKDARIPRAAGPIALVGEHCVALHEKHETRAHGRAALAEQQDSKAVQLATVGRAMSDRLGTGHGPPSIRGRLTRRSAP